MSRQLLRTWSPLSKTYSALLLGWELTLEASRFWQEKYKPRYVLPWSFMTAFWFISPAMCLMIRFYLVKQNKNRAITLADQDNSSAEQVLDIGDEVLKVDNDDLDQTDRQNLRFRYPL